MSKIHFDRGIATELADYAAHRYLCRPRDWLTADRVTLDEASVTCGTCLRMIAERLPAAVVPAKPFEPGAPYDSPPATRYIHVSRPAPRSLDRVLAQWFKSRLASPLPPAPVIEGYRDLEPVSDDRPRMPPTARGRMEAFANASWHVERAMREACAPGVSFAGGAGGVGALSVPCAACEFVVVMYLDDRKSAREIADRVAERMRIGPDSITDHQIGVVWRTLRSRMRSWLEERDVIDSDDGTLARARELPYHTGESQAPSEGTMALPPGYDIGGWKSISQETGLSASTLQRLCSSSDPPPVYNDVTGVVARKSELAAWRARQVKPRSDAA